MTTFQPLRSNWLSAGFDQFVQDDPTLPEAYGYSDYPSDMLGEGNWIDLFLDDSDRFPVGRLWSDLESNVGLIELRSCNTSYLTKSALELRQLQNAEVHPINAYNFIREQYYCGEEQTGELADANAGTAQRT